MILLVKGGSAAIQWVNNVPIVNSLGWTPESHLLYYFSLSITRRFYLSSENLGLSIGGHPDIRVAKDNGRAKGGGGGAIIGHFLMNI